MKMFVWLTILLVCLLLPTNLATGCHPTCRRLSDNSTHSQYCTEVCQPIECDVYCEEGSLLGACDGYGPNTCRHSCPEDSCELEQCPSCEVVCDPYVCDPGNECHILCAQVNCDWKCEPPSFCYGDACECEDPSCAASDASLNTVNNIMLTLALSTVVVTLLI